VARHKKTQLIIDIAYELLQVDRPMTVRQVYYQLVSRQVIKNNRSQYNAVSKALVAARQEGLIPWDWIEDRLRRPRSVDMWDSVGDFGNDVIRAYRRDVWASQSVYIEAWLEKDALSGIFGDVLRPYGVTLNVGRGYDGWDSIYNAAQRIGAGEGATILYFGDMDPSGEDMVRSLIERLAFFDCRPELIKCALTHEDIRQYNLPPEPAKRTDTRAASFIAEHGDISVELDALPANVLRARLRQEIEARLDLDALALVRQQEKQGKQQLARAVAGLAD
jgi:hypothetical protein